MIARGRVISRKPEGVVVEADGRRYIMGYGAYLIWKTFEEDSSPEEVVAQAVAISGLSREEAERLLLPFIEEMVSKGLLRY